MSSHYEQAEHWLAKSDDAGDMDVIQADVSTAIAHALLAVVDVLADMNRRADERQR